MSTYHEPKIRPDSPQEHNPYDDLIVFTCPHLVSPVFPIEAKMSQILFEGNAHIVPMPAWSSITGATRFLVAFVAMVLTAAAAGIWGNYPAFQLSLFSCVATLFIGGYHRLALGYKPVLYNRWAILGLEAFGFCFWLASFILLVRWTLLFNNSVYWGKTYLAYLPYEITHRENGPLLLRTSPGQYHAGVILAAVAAGFAGLELILFTTTLVVFSINLHKHRMAGYAAVYGVPRREPLVPRSTQDQEEKKEGAAMA